MGRLGGKGGAGVPCSQGVASPSSLPTPASLFKYFIGVRRRGGKSSDCVTDGGGGKKPPLTGVYFDGEEKP